MKAFLLCLCFATATVPLPCVWNEHPELALAPPVEYVWLPPAYHIAEPYVLTVHYFCGEQNLPVWVVARMMSWESGWRARIVNTNNPDGSTDHGIGQLNSSNLKRFRVYNEGRPIDPHDPYANIKVAIRHLGDLYAQFGDLEKALQAYNCGPRNVRRGTVPRKSVRYAQRILGIGGYM